MTPESLERLITFATPKHYLSPKSKSSLETLISGDDLPINENALNNLLKRCLDAGFLLRELQTKQQVSLRPEIDITSEDASVDDRREFLMSIPEQNWQTIIQWGQKRYMISQEMMAALARLSKGLQLTDRQTVLLWRLGNDMVKRGFPLLCSGPGISGSIRQMVHLASRQRPVPFAAPAMVARRCQPACTDQCGCP